ncbi:hypothetical protein BDN72DRAFT_958920 [Pluteus cervinus]|uniref:Uncharacterized protein n=1 Tax=Pluteus cervinus TaxID=181527 RepID=A0ACD3AXJ3_9AGAR|nr:hypothetical protein BDN72DRAFT_958920 [Pluteus cervinus]
MFKNILPSKRPSSSEFTMVTPLAEVPMNCKENHPSSVGSNPPLGLMGPPPVPTAKLTTGTTRTVLTNNKSQPPANDKKKKGDKKGKEQSTFDAPGTNQAFDKLLDDLQIPPTLRPKLAGMDATVKAAMLKSSTMIPNLKPSVVNPAMFTLSNPPESPNRSLRRIRSTESLASPRPQRKAEYGAPHGMGFYPEAPQTAGLFPSTHSPFSSALALGPDPLAAARSVHARGVSVDVPRLTTSKSHVNLPAASFSSLDLNTIGSAIAIEKEKKNEKKSSNVPAAKIISPTRFVSILTGSSSLRLDVENVKKLRLMLRNESASWTQDFLSHGGYSALLTRLNELLEVEWREEQHDDQVLHELLRCFKALSTSSIGCFALRSSCPTPFAQLVSLLYSDKKPGDVPTRQLIVELLLILFELYPPSALPSGSSGRSSRMRREAWEADSSSSNIITLPSPHKSLFSFIRSLLLTPAPAPSEAPDVSVSPHEFIESLHRPRVYKTYLQELSDVCRDYFWVFCHPGNTIWILAETDEARVEKPRAPGGMTGGVEFEAMGYFTTHLRFINAVAKSVADLNYPKESELSAWRFHSDLFLSGLERIILIARKASSTFYPTLHLELSRYIAHAARAGYELPWTVSRLVGLPPAPLCRNPPPPPQSHPSSGRSTPAGPRPGSPSKRTAYVQGPRGPPALPYPKKLEPVRLP